MAGNARIRITAEDRTRAAVATARRNFQQLGSAVAGATAAIGLSTAGMGVYLAQQAKVISENKKFAAQLGITTQSLNELAFAFGNEGNINAEQFADTLQELNVRLGEAAVTGGGPLVDAFKELGLSIQEVRSLNTDEMVLKIADAFEKLDDKQRSQFLTEEIFAGEAAKMAPLLNKGADAVKALADEYRKLNGVITEEEAEKIKELSESWGKAKIALDGVANAVLKIVTSDLAKWVNLGTEALVKFREVLEENGELVLALSKINPITWSTTLVGNIQSITNEIRGVPDTLEEVNRAIKILEEDITLTDKNTFAVGERLLELYKQRRDILAQIREDESNGPLVTVTSGKDQAATVPTFSTEVLEAIDKANYEASLEAFQTFVVDPMNEEVEANKQRAAEWAAAWNGAFETFSSGVGSAVADAIVDQSSLGDALQATMRQVAKEVISSLIRIGVQRAVQAALGQGQMAATTAAGVAQGAALTAAYAPAALAANIASFGGAALAAAASAPVAASAQVAALASTKLSGVAHDGLDYVPQTGTYLLEKGERVVKKEDNKSMMAGGMGNSYNFTIQAMDTQTGVEFLMKNENAIVDMVQQKYDQRGETGGPMR